jgi:hypothetical protein
VAYLEAACSGQVDYKLEGEARMVVLPSALDDGIGQTQLEVGPALIGLELGVALSHLQKVLVEQGLVVVAHSEELEVR